MTTTACPVMYRCYDADERLIYVGSTSSWMRRLSEHRKQSWWFPILARTVTEANPTLEAAQAAEATALQEERPTFNWRDTGRRWLERRDDWTAADHALHEQWSTERGIRPTALQPPLRNPRSRAFAAKPASGSYSVSPEPRAAFAPRSRRRTA